MKILMLGDYSNLHACLAKELHRRGHEVTVVSDRGGHMNTEADVKMCRQPGILGSIAYLYRVMAILPQWKGYDVVQLINPVFLHLKPGKLRMIFDILKRNNKSIFLTLCGDDYFFVKDCVEGKLFRFSEYRIGNEKTAMAKADPEREKGWLCRAHAEYHRYLYSELDGAMSVLPEYDMSARKRMDDKKVVFTNIPVELDNLPYKPLKVNGQIKILVGIRPDMAIQKGTGRLLEICQKLEAKHKGKIQVDVAYGLSLADYLEKIRENHVVIDQLYSYSPATNALQTMALGRVSATGWQPEYSMAIGYDGAPPVIKLQPDEDFADILEKSLQDPTQLEEMSGQARKLVEMNNDVKTVADKFEKHWNDALS